MLAFRITFVGFGLLASSVAAALKQAKVPVKIRAVSSPSTLDRAKELGLADEFFGYDDVNAWAADSDLILLCSPILHILSMLEKLSHVTPSKKILVTDIGSTKVKICEAGSKLPKPFVFVGSHPMAGSEKRTLEYSDPSIFENAYWFVCPPAGLAESEYAPLTELIAFLGANRVVFPPEHHDRTMAWVSHMPQMVSSTLAGNLPERLLSHDYQHFAGRAFRDMTRIAASGWNMWRDIALTNRDEIALALKEFADGVARTRQAIDALTPGNPSDDGTAELEQVFKAGNDGRASLFAPGHNASHSFYEISVQLKDKPGAILGVMQPLAEEHLNVRGIELMKVRENIAGTLLLAFKAEADAERAVKTLRYLGYEVKERR